MKSIYQNLSERFEELEKSGQKSKVIEIRESGRSWDEKLAAADRALGRDGETWRRRLVETARRGFGFTPEQAEIFAQESFSPLNPFWQKIKRMD